MPNPVQTVTIAQALASSSSGLLVLDTGANIANALPNTALTGRVASFTLSGPATLSAAQTLSLAQLGAKFHSGGNVLALSDTLANINSPGYAPAVALANIVEASDTAANLLAASVQNLAHVSVAIVTSNATVSVAQLTRLEAMPYFQLAPGVRLTLADTQSNIAALVLAHPAWFNQVNGMTVQLDGSLITVQQTVLLSNLMAAGRSLSFVPSGANTTLHVIGIAANMAAQTAQLNRLNNLVTKVITVSNQGAAVTVAQAQALAGLSGFSLQGSGLVLADTGAAISQNASALFGAGFAHIQVTGGMLAGSAAQLLSPLLQFQAGATAQLSASFVANAQQAGTLAALPGFSLAHGISLTVAASPADLAASAAAWAPVATSVQVTANATLSASDATTLQNIARQFGAQFSLNGHTITVSDTGHALATLPAATIGLASGFLLASSGNVTVADLSALRSLAHFSLNGFALTVSDSATNLLRLSGNVSPATATQLSANASGLSALQFSTLSALPGFSVNGHSLGVQDSVANLLGLQTANLSQVSSITLSASATVTALVANHLAAEHGFSAGPNGLTVQDSAANLLTLSNAARAVAAAEILPSGPVTLTASQGIGLAALPHFSSAGAVITISDTVANLSTSSTWAQIASAYDVVDTAANLAAAEISNGVAATLLHGATVVTLSQPATNVSAATVAALAGIAAFATDGTALAVSDNAANLAANASAVRELASSVAVSGPATIGLSQAAALAGIAGAFGNAFSRGGNTLTLAGTPADLLGVTQAEAALIGGYQLSAPATVSVQTFGVLRALPQFSDNGFALTLADTATNLLALTGSTALVSAAGLTADATVNAALYLALAALPGLSANGHVLTVLDNAAGLYSLRNANLTPVSITELSGNAAMSAAQANAVIAEPGFSANGHTITISDTAANLITLSHAAQVAATSILLSADSTVTASQMPALTAFGVKFFTDGHALTVQDSAGNLAGLSLAAIGLATAEQINVSATVNASVAVTLAALPALSLANGVTLTVQDTATNLLALGNDLPSAATSEMLLPGTMTLSAAQAAGLAGLPHFSATGATITVTDNVANLAAQANTGWSTIASATDVVDSAANLAAAASTNLLQHANLVALSGNAVITAAQAVQLAGIPQFSAGSAVLQVADSPASIAAAQAAISAVAGQAVVSSSGTVNASQADALAGIASLSFARGVQLTVQDSFANLTSDANASGLELATRLTVADSAANLAAAAANNWGGLNPSYLLSQNGTISAAQGITLASLGSHYANGGNTLTVSDTAAAIGAAASTLQTLGARLTSVAATDTSPVSASVAAGLSGLAGKLVSTVLTVNDSAGAITQYQSQLTTLGIHARVQVTDTAANVVANAAALQALASQVLLGDSPTLSSAGLATLAQVATALGSNFSQNGHSITLQDSSANILLRAPAQLALAAAVVVTDTISLSQASALENAGLAAKLSGNLAVADSAQNLVSDLTGGAVLAALRAGAEALAITVAGGTLSLTNANATTILGAQASRALMADLVPATIVSVSGVPASGFAAIAASGWPNLAVTIADSAANTGSAAASITSALQHFSGTLTVTLTDSQAVTAQIAANLLPFAQYLAGGTALAVTDSAANVSAVAAALTTLTSALGTVTLTGTFMDAPTASAIAPLDQHLAPGVRLTVTDSAANIDTNRVRLAQLNTDSHLASVIVQNASVADLVAHRAAIDALPTHLVIRDTAANLAADLTGGASVLTAETAKITSVTLSAGGIVGAAALRDMAALPGFSLGSATLALSDTASAIDTLGSSVLNLALTATIRDSAANVGTAAQAILTAFNLYTGTASIALTDTAPASAQTAANLAAVASLLAQGTSLNVSDSAANVRTNAAGLGTLGSALGTITLQSTSMDAATAASLTPLAAHLGQGVLLNVTDSSHAIAQNLSQLEALGTDQHLGTVTVSGESASTVSPNISAINSVSAQVSISDTGDDVVAALATLAGIHHLVSITLTNSSTPTLTMALSTLQTASGVLAKIVSSYTIQILDTATNIQSDIISGGSGLIAGTSQVTSVAVSNGATVSLSQSQLLASTIGTTVQFTGALGVSSVDVGHLSQVAARGATAIAVSDIAANITGDLTSGNSVLATQARHGVLSSVTSTSGAYITLSAAQAEAAGVDDSAHSVIALLSGATLTISSAAIASLSGLSLLYTAPASVAVADSSANVSADLVSGHSALAAAGNISVVSITGGTLGLTGAQAHTILQTPALIAMVGLISQHNALNITGASLADAMSIFSGENWTNVSLSVAESAADLANNHTLLPISAQVSVFVTDSAAAIGAQGSGLAYLVNHSVTFTLTLTDTLPVIASVAGALGAYQAHLASGTVLAVNDSAAAIGANASNIGLLGSALGAVTLTNTSLNAADAAGLLPFATHLAGTVSVSDTAAQIYANRISLATLQTDGKIASITVPADTVSGVTQYYTTLNALGATVSVSDTATNIGNGLATLAAVNGLTTITVQSGGTVNVAWTISQLASDHAVLGKVSGTYALGIADTAQNIENDLALGNASILKTYGGLLSGVSVSSGGPVYLTAAQLLASGIDTGANAALAHFSGTLDATNASVSQIASLLAAQDVPAAIAISDTAQNIQNDLASGTGNSMLLLHASKISSISVSGGSVTLTVSQAMAAGVDDGAGSAVAKITGMGTFTVTGVAVSQLAGVLALNIVPVIDISDIAQNLENAVTTLAADRAHIGAIAQSDGAIFTITANQALTTGVADGAGSVLNLMGNPVYDVTGAHVSQISALRALASGTPTQISVSDTSQNILAAIINGGSALAQQFDNYNALGTVSVTGGVLSATADQIAQAAGNGTGSIGILGILANGTTIDIQDVTVGDITSLLSYNWSGTRLEITDSAGNLASDLTGGASVLQAHSGVIGSVTLSAGGTLSATALADMHALPSFSLGGFTLALADTAGNVAAMSNALLGLINAITVTDNAQNIGSHEASLLALSQNLTGTFTIYLTDTQPVLASVAANVQPLAGLLHAGNVLSVSDTASAIAGNMSALQALGAKLNTLTVTDATVSAANAATISALAAHLGSSLTIADNAAAITTSLAGLQALQTAGKLAAVNVAGAAVSDVLANLTALNDVNAQVSVSDTASDVAGGLATLSQLNNLHAIALTGGGTPTLALNVSALGTYPSVLGKISGSYAIAISDTAGNIQADLENAGSSLLASNTHLASITVSSGGSVILTQQEFLASAIGNGVTFSGTLAVTNVDLADLASVVARSPASISVADTTQNIQADLTGVNSLLAAQGHAGLLAGVQGSGGTITLSVSQIEAAGVDDGVHSVAAVLSGASLAVSGALISDLANLALLQEVPSIGIADNANTILGALVTNSSLYDIAASVTTISVNGTLSLTDAQAQTMLGDATLDGLVTKIASDDNTVHITGVTVADLPSLISSGWQGLNIAVVDGAAAIAGAATATLDHAQNVTVSDSALAVGNAASSLATALAAYAVQGRNAVIDLTDSAAVGAHVAANLAPVASYLAPGTSLDVSDAAGTVATYANQLGELGNALGTITLASNNVDAATAAALQPLDSHLGSAHLNVSDSATQVAVNENALLQLRTDGHLGTVAVVNDSVYNVAPQDHINRLNALNATVTISDSAINVQGGIDALAQLHHLTAITLSDLTTPTITVSIVQLGGDQSVISAIQSSFVLAVSDSASAIEADLALGAGSVLAQYGAQIGALSAGDGNPVVLSQSVFLGAGIDNGAHSALAHFSGTLDVTGVDVAHLPAVLLATTQPTHITVNDSSDHIVSDLMLGGGSKLAVAQSGGELAQIDVNGGTITLDSAQALDLATTDAANWAAVEGLFNTSTTLAVTGVSINDATTVESLHGGTIAGISIAISDTAAAITGDLAGSDVLGTLHSAEELASVTLSQGGTVLASQLTAMSGLTGFSDGGYSLSVSDSATSIASLTSIALGFATSVTVTDTAADIGPETSALLTALAAYTNPVTIDLTDTNPVNADTAAALAPLAGYSFGGNQLTISDQLGHLVTDAQALSALISAGAIGTISPTDANTNTLDVLDAAALAPLAGNFAGGTQLMVAGTAAQINANATALTTLYTDGDLASVTVSGASMSDVIQNHTALNAVHAAVSVNTNAANVQSFLHALSTLNNLVSIALSDSGTPSLTYGISDIGSYATTLAKITAPVDIDASDTAQNIASDLLLGASSVLSSNFGLLHEISVSDSNPVTLTQTQVLSGGAVGTAIANVLGSSKFQSTVEVTGVDLADVSNVGAVITAPTTWAISDTAINIQGDIAAYGTSSTLQSLTQGTNTLASITVTGGGTITLSAAIAKTIGVDDSAASLLAKVSGASLGVDQAQVSDLAALDQLQVVPASIAVSDGAQHIADDLNLGAQNSELLANRSTLSNVAVNDNGTVSLTAATALATHVDDGAGSVVSKLSGPYTLEVTGVAVNQVLSVLALAVAPTEITISDTAAHIAADIDGAGLLAAHSGVIQSVTLTQGGTVNATELTAMHGLPSFSTGGNFLVVQDGAASIAALAGNVLGLAYSVHVVDSGSAISTNIDNLASALSGYSNAVTIAATGTVTVSTTQYTNDLAVLQGITGTGVLTVIDTAANLAAAASTLESDAKVGYTALSANATGISTATLATLAGLPNFSLGGNTITVAGNVSDVLGQSANIASYVSGVTISDTNSNIQSNLDALQAEFAHFSGTLAIHMSVGGISVGAGTFVNDRAIIDSITVGGPVSVDDSAQALVQHAAAINSDSEVTSTLLTSGASVDAASLATLCGLTGFSTNTWSLGVQDTETALLSLSADQLNVATSVSVQDSAAGIGASAASLATLLASYTNGASPTITLTDTSPVLASVAASINPVLAYLANNTSLNVSDTPAHIATYASGLQTLNTTLGTITLSTTTMNAATAAAIQPLDSHLANGVRLTVTGSASDIHTNIAAIDQLNTDGHLASIQVQGLTINGLTSYQSEFDALQHTLAIADTAGHIAADLTGGASLLTAEAANIASVTLTSAGTVTAPALTAMTALSGFSLGSYQLTVADLATNLLQLGNTALGFAHAVQVQDTGSAVAAHIDALETKFATTANFSMAVTGGNGCVSINATQYTNDKTVIDTITTQGAVTITDTASALAAIASAVNADTVMYATQLSASATVNAATLSTLSTLTGFGTNSFTLTLADADAGVLGLTNAALNLATNVLITDTSAHVSNDLAAISALSGYAGALHITLSDGSPAISVAATNFTTDRVAIAAITNANAVTVSGTAAQVAGIAGALASIASVGSVTVSGTASDIAANLPALQTIAGASKLHVTLTDSSIPANLVTPLLSISGSLTNGVAVADTPAQLAALAESSAQAATYLNTYGATLNASGSLGVNDAAALEGLTNFHLGGNTLAIWDTASHLTAASASVFTNPSISGVYLKTGGSATITAATAAALLAIPNFSSANPPGQVGTNQLTISDTAAHLASYYSTLVSHLAQFTGGIMVSASATVLDSDLTKLQALHAMPLNGGVALTVRDTAANIAASAAAQAASPYITPSTWQVSGNATISEAQAAVLGGLTGISVGGYTLTLSLTGDTSISIADAANLGRIASSLALGGHALLVSGTASQLGALSNTALGLVTPQLSDTFAHILAVNNALLLKGTVTVTDPETISAAQATSFLNMLTTQGGAIHPASLSFAGGTVETVSDTIQNLQTLQTSAGWTGNTGVHSAFSLVAADTVANLINAGNTTFLHSLAGSTLSTSQTTDAASAESLALLANTIHFSTGSTVLTVSDTASNLLNASNVDGLALAGAVQLSQADTVSAAGAESLFGVAHFTLNQSLTITDSSANLLDGVLSGDIGGHSAYVHVELAGSEILDADTASSLVALTGFTDPNGYLNIADSSSYLLASGNLTAEAIASSVTLAGDETVSANTVLRLSELPHFNIESNNLTLASSDYADAATLKAIADLGANFNADGHTVTVTAETLNLTPAEFSALQSDSIAQGGHVVAAISDASNTLTISGLGVAGDTIKIYDHTGNLISSTGINAGNFTVTAADAGMNHNFAVTDISGGTESAPVVVLDAAGLETAVTNAGASFANYGQIEVDTGKYLNIYLHGATLPAAPALVYDATQHTISLDIPNQAPVTLVTLGGSTLPSSLTAAEIFIKHHS